MSSLLKVLTAVAFTAGSTVAFTGDMTFYDLGLGACGWTNHEGDPVVALNPSQWEGGRHCGSWITIQGRGHQTAAQVVDLCPGCSSGDIDVSRVIFDDIASLDEGRVQVTWFFQ